MGGFYGSAQVRCEDRQLVKQAAEDAAKALGIKCYIGPVLNGWIGIYPEGGGQDPTVAQLIAAKVGAPVFHAMVHDSDVFAYWFWEGGQEIDSYWSRPGYFGDENLQEQEAMSGRPEAFASIAPDAVEPMRKLLARDDSDRVAFEENRLAQFAQLLGISNVLTSYDYLKEGDRDGIERWGDFEELPADVIAQEKNRGRERRKRINALKRELKDAGVLLYEETQKWARPEAWTAGDSIFVAWGHSVSQYRPPWQEGISVSSDRIVPPCPVSRQKATHPGGAWIATGLPSGALAIQRSRTTNSPREFFIGGERQYGQSIIEFARQRVNDAMVASFGDKWTPELQAKVEEQPFWRDMLEKLSVFQAELAQRPKTPNEHVMCLRFTASGQYLCCGTGNGFRVYAWDEILKAPPGDMPSAKWSHDDAMPNSTGTTSGYVYAIAEEPSGLSVAFGGYTGRLWRMDLRTGEVTLLVSLPEDDEWIQLVVLSLDGTALGIGSWQRPLVRPRRDSGRWSMWSYPELLKRAVPQE